MIYRRLTTYEYEFKAGANVKNYLKGVLSYTVGLKDDISHPVYIYPREGFHQYPKFLCAYPSTTQFSNEENPELFNHLEYYQFSFVNVNSEDETEEYFFCKNKKFSYQTKKRVAPALKIPNWSEIDDGYVDIVLPYSLTGELNDSLTKVAIRYFKALRYKLTSKPIEDVKAFVESELLTTDVLMPAGHGLASRNLSIGTKKGTLLSFTREKRKNDKYGVRFHFILPQKNEKHESINIAELASSYEERMRSNPHPLFVFVISCGSVHNIFDWSLIYRRAIESFGSDPALLPFVIGSSRGFPTSNNVEIASNIFFPTDVADMLASGYTPEQVYIDLQTRTYGSVAQEFIRRIGQAWLPIKKIYSKERDILGDIFEEPTSNTFSPEYNFSEKYRDTILKMAGRRHLLYQEGTLLMDETY